MKKLVMALAAAWLLTGCTPAQPPQTEPTETTAVTETTQPPKTLYVPASPMERSTGGAVQTYEAEGQITGLSVMGENLLLSTDHRMLWLLDGSTTEEIRVRELDREILWGDSGLQITDSGIAYYDAASATYVTLDENLSSGPSYVLSGKVTSQPLISSDFSAIYYATEEGLRRMELQEGTSRLLRQESGEILSLDGMLFDDQWIYYTRRSPDGTEQTCFVDASTGSLSRTNRFAGRLVSEGNRFTGVIRVEHAMGDTRWVVFGDHRGDVRMLEAQPGWGDALILENGWVILQQESKLGLSLACFDPERGEQVARILMPQLSNTFVFAGIDGDGVWLSDGVGSRFYRWDLRSSGEETEPVGRIVPYASLSHPNEEAMAAVEARADALGKELGMEVLMVPGDNRTDGVDYAEQPDYRIVQYAQALERTKIAADRLPADLLRQVRQKTERSRLRLALVDGYDPAWEVRPGTGSYRVDGGSAQINVVMCKDLESIFYHELFHVMEVQLRNRSDRLKEWDSLNPEGFAYTGESEKPERMVALAPEYPGGAPVADGHSMVSGREDRAQLFMYACMDGQADRFASETMQAKLRFLSQLIRSTYRITDAPVWEQYLLPEAETPPATTEP